MSIVSSASGPPSGVVDPGALSGVPHGLCLSASRTVLDQSHSSSSRCNSVTQRQPNVSDGVVLGRTGVFARSLHEDVSSLIREYVKTDHLDYTTFRSLWRLHQFYLIHFSCCDENERKNFLGVLFQMFLNFLSPDESFTAQAGAIYGLYLLYLTQPSVFKKAPIRLTISTWQNLEQLYRLAFDYDATDLIYVIHKLRERNAFLYVAENEKIIKELSVQDGELYARTEKSLVRMEKQMNSSILVPVEGLLKNMTKLATEYHEAKADLASLALSRKASEMVMARLRTVRPPNMDPLTATPVPDFLKESEARARAKKAASNNPALEEVVSVPPNVASAADEILSLTRSATDPDVEMTDATTHVQSSSSPSFQQQTPFPIDEPVYDLTSAVTDSPATDPAVEDLTSAATHPPSTNPAGVSLEKRKKKRQSRARNSGGILDSMHYHLPFVFPLSMLQASEAGFTLPMEDIVRQYYRGRMARYNFAVAGELPRNDYTFPEVVSETRSRRIREDDGLTTKDRGRRKRKMRRDLEIEERERQKRLRAAAGETGEVADAGAGEQMDEDYEDDDGTDGGEGDENANRGRVVEQRLDAHDQRERDEEEEHNPVRGGEGPQIQAEHTQTSARAQSHGGHRNQEDRTQQDVEQAPGGPFAPTRTTNDSKESRNLDDTHNESGETDVDEGQR